MRMNTFAPEIDPPVIHNGVIFLDEEKTDKPAGARITVDEIYKETLLAPTFWPRPIYTRIFVINKNASGALGQTKPQDSATNAQDADAAGLPAAPQPENL